MNKELLISIKPEHLVDILNGVKTLELRKTVPKNYNGWVNIYCTKNEILEESFLGYRNLSVSAYYNNGIGRSLSGKVVARFWFDEYIELEHYDFWGESYYWKNTVISAFELEKATCMNSFEMEEYAKGKTLYAWHIKKLEIFDKPKELNEFYKNDSKWSVHYYVWSITDCILLEKYALTKPPQSYQFVYVKENLK